MHTIKLMGAWEIQQRLGVSRQRTNQIVNRKGFPDPYQTLRMGSVWDAELVEAWIREHRKEIAEDTEGDGA
jgi:predicted DNA-binding transcriptional regulator AlpA